MWCRIIQNLVYLLIFVLKFFCIEQSLYAAADKRFFDYAFSHRETAFVEVKEEKQAFKACLSGLSYYPSGSAHLAKRHSVVVDMTKLPAGEFFVAHRSGLVEATVVQVPKGFRKGDGVVIQAATLLANVVSCEADMSKKTEPERFSVDIDLREHEQYLLLALSDARARRVLRYQRGSIFAMRRLGERVVLDEENEILASCRDRLLKKVLDRIVTLNAVEEGGRRYQLNEALLRSCMVIKLYERIEKITFSAGQLYHPGYDVITVPDISGIDDGLFQEPHQDLDICSVS